MERRQFLAASLATSAVALAGRRCRPGAGQPREREFYQMRRYNLMSGPQTQADGELSWRCADSGGWSGMGMGPVGAFRLDIGQDTPAYYVLIPGPSAEALAELDLRLGKDADFLKVAAPFWNATATAPAFQRVEISLLEAFQGWPKMTPPAPGTKGKRIFQLRTYESPSNGDHVRKVEMFHSGEFEIFLKAGFHPVFFGDALIGLAAAEPDLHAELCGHGGAGGEVGCVPQRSGMEEALDEPAVRVRPDCDEYFESDSEPAGVFAGIGETGKVWASGTKAQIQI